MVHNFAVTIPRKFCTAFPHLHNVWTRFTAGDRGKCHNPELPKGHAAHVFSTWTVHIPFLAGRDAVAIHIADFEDEKKPKRMEQDHK
jgi:hypothetical protein